MSIGICKAHGQSDRTDGKCSQCETGIEAQLGAMAAKVPAAEWASVRTTEEIEAENASLRKRVKELEATLPTAVDVYGILSKDDMQRAMLERAEKAERELADVDKLVECARISGAEDERLGMADALELRMRNFAPGARSAIWNIIWDIRLGEWP